MVAVATDGGELLAEAGGLLQHLASTGTPLDVLVAEGANARVFARCGLRTVPVHRLGLRRPLPPGAEGDLLAALSELIGFDPEPGLGILAPAELADRPDRAVVGHVAGMAARVYGAELVHSAPHAPGTPGYALTRGEAARKRYAVGAAAAALETVLAELRIPAPRTG
ncbi:hypothetical protein GCM10023175_69250 [Pseudonocardia xishanensis]|uniref:Uncharacterized protein n=1 Tax=Pseudonocardia xishanensis TaxID=630995 RepID=A0ABP8S588_9PSEU